MADLELSLMMSASVRSRPVLDGTVKPDGIVLRSTIGHPSEIFWRQLKFQEFDVSEMSLSSLLIAMSQGNRDWIGLPIFTTRRFFHTGVWVRSDRGIDRPEDLKGKQVAVPEYQQTAALWARGALQHEWGVAPSDVAQWHMERPPDRSHGGATGFAPPPGVNLTYIPEHKSIGSMLIDGEIDATLMYIQATNLVDRSTARLEDNPKLRLLFPDPPAEGRRYYAKTGLYPINHGMVVRRSIAERHPWVVLNIYNAFMQAKERGHRQLDELTEGHLALGLLPPESRRALREDPFPYGVQSNRKVLETITEYSHEQGLTPRRMQLDEVFAPATLDL